MRPAFSKAARNATLKSKETQMTHTRHMPGSDSTLEASAALGGSARDALEQP